MSARARPRYILRSRSSFGAKSSAGKYFSREEFMLQVNPDRGCFLKVCSVRKCAEQYAKNLPVYSILYKVQFLTLIFTVLTAMDLKSPILENGNKFCMTDIENVSKMPCKISQLTFLFKGFPQQMSFSMSF
jgi:hypothetical protein